MKIVQIAIGIIPKELQVKMNKWERLGYDYELITELPEAYQKYGNRIGTDFLRMDILSEQSNVLYADWDTEPIKVLNLDNTPIFFTSIENPLWWYEGIDCCMYNGIDTVLFKEAKKYLNGSEGSIVFAINRALKKRYVAYMKTIPKKTQLSTSFKLWIEQLSNIKIDNKSVNHLGYNQNKLK
ncbi:MAG: hypothetical protein ACOCZ5_00010 [bacterium]